MDCFFCESFVVSRILKRISPHFKVRALER